MPPGVPNDSQRKYKVQSPQENQKSTRITNFIYLLFLLLLTTTANYNGLASLVWSLEDAHMTHIPTPFSKVRFLIRFPPCSSLCQPLSDTNAKANIIS